MNKILEILSSLFNLFMRVQTPLEIIDATKTLPWHKTRTWSKRGLKSINKIIVHQELGMGTVAQVNNYHITPGEQNHLSKRGAPHFSYHYGIDLDGTVYKANNHSCTTWHTKGQNSVSLAILVAGDFAGDSHKGKISPSKVQKKSLQKLLDHLILETGLTHDDVYGHCDFGKPACPGYELYQIITRRKS